MEQPEQEEAKGGLQLWSVTKLRITEVSIRGSGRGGLSSLEHSLNSFPSNLLCPGEHLTQKGVSNCLQLPGVGRTSKVPQLPTLYPSFLSCVSSSCVSSC